MSTTNATPDQPESSTPPTDDFDNLNNAEPRLFARSPNPYHRRNLVAGSNRQLIGSEYRSASTPASVSQNTSRRGSDGVLEQDGKSSRKTSSQSGSEADDEGYGLIRALPAPPVRPRKGLRDRTDEDDSPFLSPSQLDSGGRRRSVECLNLQKDRVGLKQTAEDEDARARARYRRRRMAELFRRIVETGLLASIGYLVIKQRPVRNGVRQKHRGNYTARLESVCIADQSQLSSCAMSLLSLLYHFSTLYDFFLAVFAHLHLTSDVSGLCIMFPASPILPLYYTPRFSRFLLRCLFYLSPKKFCYPISSSASPLYLCSLYPILVTALALILFIGCWPCFRWHFPKTSDFFRKLFPLISTSRRHTAHMDSIEKSWLPCMRFIRR